MEAKIIMSQKELKQAHVLRNYNEGKISRKEAGRELELSERQITRKAKDLREKGEKGLIHKNTGRKPAHALTEEQKAEIVRIRKEERYAGSNISHFRDLLREEHGIHISYDPLYRLLQAAGIKSPKKHRENKKERHRRRERRERAGELVQIDATPYEWFGDGKKYALHGVIDDATGIPTGLYISENECLHGYFEVMKQTIEDYGVPLSVYSDKHTIFRSPKTRELDAKGGKANPTQFGRALFELGMNIIHAHSPQAKGRIERLWGTLQSRLPVEFRIRNIKTVDAANAFLKNEYRKIFANRFSVAAKCEPIFVPYTHPTSLADILCIKGTRKLDNAGTFTYKGQHFKILDEGYPLIPARASVLVFVGMDSAIRVQYKNQIFNVRSYSPVTTIKEPKKMSAVMSPSVVPHLLHSSDAWKAIWHYEDYQSSMNFLFDLFLKDSSIFHPSRG